MTTESVILRTLTEKSILWFGKYSGMSVQQVIDLKSQTYLRWIYYNMDGITFTIEVLNVLTISLNRRIPKPGTAPEMHHEIINENIEAMHIHTKMHMDKVIKIRAKSRYYSTCNSVNFKKSALQAINLNRY